MIPRDIRKYTREIPEPATFLFRHGAEIEGLWVFPVIKNKLSFIRCICHLHLLRSEHEDKTHTHNAAWRAKIVDALVLCLFMRVESAKTRIPLFEPHMADNAITRGYI